MDARARLCGSVVLLYHRVGSPFVRSVVAGQYVLPSLFRRQLRAMIASGYLPVTLEAAVDAATAERRFAVTFDDGYASFARRALPVLAEMGVPATVFVVVGAIGGTNKWDQLAGDRVEPMMSKQEILDVSAAGVEVGSHTLSHPRLTQLSQRALEREVRDSKAVLEDLLGRVVTSFSYPYGDWDERTRDAVASAGYRLAVATTRGVIRPSVDKLAIPRVNVRWNAIGPVLLRKVRMACRAAEVPLRAHP